MRRRLFTTEQFYAGGGTRAQLRWRARRGLVTRVVPRVYAEGGEEPNEFERALGRMLASKTTAWGTVASVLHGHDGVEVGADPVKRRYAVPIDATTVVIEGIACTSALQTIVDLAELVDDLVWEQALETSLRKKHFGIEELTALLPAMSKSRRHGVGRIRRVLELRPVGAPPTESLLETLMVQLIRGIHGLPEPVRQFEVFDAHGLFVARVDLCWPELGLFVELDGMHHEGQPLYDARRETAVVAATGWLCGRFTWREVVRNPKATAHRLAALAEQARRRPLAAL